MDFAVLGLEGLVGSGSGAGAPSSVSVPHETVTKVVGSRFGNQERSRSGEDDRGETSKLAKTGSDSSAASKAMPLHHGTPLLRSNSLLSGDTYIRQQEQMLSFSSLKSDVIFLGRSNSLLERSSQVPAFPNYHHTHPAYARAGAASYGSGSLSASMHVPFSGVRGPFTPNQWIELEHQALIYKYITANVPVPSNLLISLKKSLYPYGLAYSSAVSYPPNSYQWGSFHLGFAGNTDPEPGRCRRTDGKKWRCSRDAVADQKYCERHINRGRHRSRKPVEGQTGQAASGTTSPKVVPTSSMSASGGASNGLAITQQPFKNLQPGAANPSADALVNRVQDSRSVSMMSSTISLKSNESTFSMSKQDIPFEESSLSVFGLVTSDSLLNPSQRGSYLNSKNYGGSFLDFNDQETQDQHCLRQFINDWPKDESSRSIITWPDELKSDLTQLSMSIPIAPSAISSTSSPTPEKLALSPLRLSREFHPTHMGLGVNNDLVEPTLKQTNWIPVSWGTSMGGPLGEVLTNSTNNVGTYKSSASLNLATEHWDSSLQLGSSPTGVLQKSTFGSLSSSSSGSSPVTESKKTYGGTNLCDDVLGSTLVSSSSIPSL